MFSFLSLDKSSRVQSPQISLPIEQPPQSDHIIILENSNSIIKDEEAPPQNLQELIECINQLARFPLLAHPEQLALLPSRLNEALQKEPCFLLEHYQTRIVQLRKMLIQGELLQHAERLCAAINQHIIHAEQAAKTLHRESATPVQDSLWPLHERILRLSTLEPDLFGAAVAMLQEKLPHAIFSNPLIEQLQQLLPQLLPPTHYLWGQEPPFTAGLEQLEEIKRTCLILRNRLKQAPENYVRTFHAPMQSIYETYRSFLQDFTNASDEKKIALRVPKAQLSGVGLGFFLLDQEQARALLCRNAQGKTVKENPLGTHAVHFEEGVFYKPNPEGRFYIGPEMEFAIYALYQLLGQQGAAPTSLAKIRHVFFEGLSGPFGKVLQAGLGIEGISLQDVLGMADAITFFKSSLGTENGQKAFKELLEEDLKSEYTKANPALSEEALSSLTLEDVAERLIQKFETPIDPNRRCLEFAETPTSDKTKIDFYFHISTHSTRLLTETLALLERYPGLAHISHIEGPRQTSFTELTDLCHYVSKIRRHFPGLSAQQLLQELPQIVNRFDSTNFSAHFVVTLLTNPFDHKTDNLMVALKRSKQGIVGSLSLVGIDNDLAFASSEEGVRSILYLLEPMNAPFDPTIAQRILEITAEGLVLDWLMALEEQNQRYQRWQKQGVLTEEDLFEEGEPCLRIPFKIDAQLIPTLYNKARLLVGLLKTDPSSTHWDLLHALQPKLAQAYENAMRSSDTPERAYHKIPHLFPNVAKASPTPVIKQTTAEAALSFLETIDLSSFPLKLQVSLIGKALQTFPASSHTITLPGDPKEPLTRREFFLMAVMQGHNALVARLLEEEKKSRLGKNEKLVSLIEVRNQEEQTALLLACCRLDVEMIRLLIHYGADPQVHDIGGRTALALCIMRLPDAPEQAAATARFLGDHAPILFNAASGHRGWSPLRHLVEAATKVPEEAEPLITYLIEKGASPDLVDNKGKTPLDRAIELDQERLIKQLIGLGGGKTLNVPAARTYFASHPHLNETFKLLQSQSLLMRWELALDTLRATHAPGSQVTLEGAQIGKISLSSQLEEELLDNQGNIIPQSDYGRRNVHRLVLPNGHELYFKQYPEMPGVEYAIDTLFEMLIGHGTSFTDLAKITLSNGRSYPVLISQGIQGENFHNVLKNPAEISKLAKIDPLAFSELFLASLLVNFEDAKPDNFILESQPGGSYRLVGIDNDHAFVPALVKAGGSTVQVKCILYCLELMKQPIHPSARERFLSFSPERLLTLWLNRLKQRNTHYCLLFPQKEREQLFDIYNGPGVVIPIPFKKGAMADLYQKFQRLQMTLKESPQLTGMEILRIVIPSLGVRYEEAFHDYKDPLARFLSLTNTHYSTAIAGRLGTLINSQQTLKSMAIPEKDILSQAADDGPTCALQELSNLRQEMELSIQALQQIRDGLQNGDAAPFNGLRLDTVKEKVINGIAGAFEGIDFNAMRVSGRPDLVTQKYVLEAILTGNYRSLRLKGCAVLDKVAFDQLLRRSPRLHSLELRNCSSVNEEMLAQLSQARYLTRLRLNQLPQLAQVRLPHPTLRQLEITNCQGLKELTISHTLKSLSIEACWNLSTIQARVYLEASRLRGPRLAKEAPKDFMLQNLHLKACPKLQPWQEMFDKWLQANPIHEINLQEVPPNPDRYNSDLWLVIKAVLQQPKSKEILASLIPALNELRILALSEHDLPHPQLASLDLSPHSEIITDEILLLLIQHCPNLTSIDLSECAAVTDTGLQCLALTCPNLTSVNLKLCKRITDAGVQYLAKSCPLTSLNLFGCEEITDAGVYYLGQECPGLTFIDLGLCNKISETAVHYLAKGCPNLASINLRCNYLGALKITGKSRADAMLRGTHLDLASWVFPNLTSINLAWCQWVADKGLKDLVKACPNLTFVDLSCCNMHVGAQGLRALAQGCPNLRHVDLSGTNSFTAKDLPPVRKAYPNVIFHYPGHGVDKLKRARDALQDGNIIPFNELQLDTAKEEAINGISNLFEGIDFSAIPDLIKQTNVLEAILTGKYRSLRLKGCAVLDTAAFEQLLANSSQLHSLELLDCSVVTEEMLASLSQAPQLIHLRLNQLQQLQQVRLPHPTLRQLEITNCRGLQKLIISHTLKSLSIEGCRNLSSIQAKLYQEASIFRGPEFAKETLDNFVLENLHLKTCPKVQPWWRMFQEWLDTSPKHEIWLRRVPVNPIRENPEHLRLVINAVLQVKQAKEMLVSLKNDQIDQESELIVSHAIKNYQTNKLQTQELL